MVPLTEWLGSPWHSYGTPSRLPTSHAKQPQPTPQPAPSPQSMWHVDRQFRCTHHWSGALSPVCGACVRVCVCVCDLYF